MLAAERRNQIKAQVMEHKSVSVTELSKKFHVTAETIRRDLKQLENEGALQRSYGGAFVQTGVTNLVDHEIRKTAFVDSKQTIAKLCRPLISNGDTIFLDNSTTAYFIARVVADMRITIVTNNLQIINLIADTGTARLVIIGGSFSPKEKGTYGAVAVKTIGEYYFDKAFVSCRSLSKNLGASESREQWAEVRQAIIRRADECYLVADYSKFGHTSFIKICDFRDLAAVVTDRPQDPSWHQALAEAGCKLIDGSEG